MTTEFTDQLDADDRAAGSLHTCTDIQSAASNLHTATPSTVNISSLQSESHQPSANAALSARLDSANAPSPFGVGDAQSPRRARMARTESSMTHREKRRATLAEKLQEVFELNEVEEVLAEYSCWLFRSVLLQGFLYLTSGHLCFYAYLQGQEGQTVRSGSLFKKSSKSPLFTKFWMILRDDTLSWYSSSTDPYFPLDQINLHYITGVQPSKKVPKRFKVSTATKAYTFEAESEKSQQEWIKVIKKSVFRAQNEGESVKVGICSMSRTSELDILPVTDCNSPRDHSCDRSHRPLRICRHDCPSASQ